VYSVTLITISDIDKRKRLLNEQHLMTYWLDSITIMCITNKVYINCQCFYLFISFSQAVSIYNVL